MITERDGGLYEQYTSSEGDVREYYLGPAPAPAPTPAPSPVASSAPSPVASKDKSEYWTASDPRWNDPEQIGKKVALEGFWDMILPQMGFKGPLTVERKLEQPQYSTTAEGDVIVADTETVRSPEAQQAIDKLKAAGYDVAMKHPDKRTFKSFYGITTPSGEVKDVALAGSDFGTTLQDMAKTVGPIALAAFGNPAAIGAALGASGATATALGTAVLSGAGRALAGGGLEDILKSAVLGGVGSALAPVGQVAGQAVSEAIGGDALGNILGRTVSGATQAGIGSLLTGKDPLEALKTSAVTGGIGAMGSEYLQDLPKPLQSAITSAVASEILGGDTEASATRAFLRGLPSYAGEVARRPDTNEEGFFAPGGERYDSWGREEHVFDPTFGGVLPQPETVPYEVEPLPFDDAFIRETERLYQDFPEFEEPFIPIETGPGGTDIRDERERDYVEGVDINDPSNYPRSPENPYGYDPNTPWNQPLPVTPSPAPVSTAAPTPSPAPAPAAKSGNNTAAMLAMLAQMGFQEQAPTAPYQVAQIPVKSPFGLMYGMDQTGPYGMRG